MNDLQRLPSGDLHPAFAKARLSARGLTLTDLAKRHGKHESYFRVALTAPYATAMRVFARAIRLRPHEAWPSLFDERDRTIKARRATRSTRKLSVNGRSRTHASAA
jgi:lambda repressor-like predicted transcriptional regulator